MPHLGDFYLRGILIDASLAEHPFSFKNDRTVRGYEHLHSRRLCAVYTHTSEFAVQSEPYVGHRYDLSR